jgi:hypothetical protein
VINEVGFRNAAIVEMFDPFLGTSKEKTARKFGVQGVNILAQKP